MKFILVAIVLFMATETCYGANCGMISWYDLNSRTASGEKMSSHKRTTAHRRLPFGTMLKITNMKNGKTSVAKVNDRGPFVRNRVLDVSVAVARDLGIMSSGTGKVCYQIL